MRKVISEAQELMERVVQVNPQMHSVSNGLMQQMVTDSMKFDVSEIDGQVAAAEQDERAAMVVDDEMISVPPVECSSIISMSLPQNSYYFHNVRHIDNPYAIAKRSKTFVLFEQ